MSFGKKQQTGRAPALAAGATQGAEVGPGDVHYPFQSRHRSNQRTVGQVPPAFLRPFHARGGPVLSRSKTAVVGSDNDSRSIPHASCGYCCHTLPEELILAYRQYGILSIVRPSPQFQRAADANRRHVLKYSGGRA